MNVQEFFSALRVEKTALHNKFPQGYCFTTSLDKYASVAEVSIDIAARTILENKGRLSTDAEVVQFKERGEAFSRRMASQAHNHRKSEGSGTVFILSR